MKRPLRAKVLTLAPAGKKHECAVANSIGITQIICIPTALLLIRTSLNRILLTPKTNKIDPESKHRGRKWLNFTWTQVSGESGPK